MSEEPTTPTPTETEPTEPAPTEPEPLPPPPLAATPTESLAEQVLRESHELPDSQNPSDIVPNRPNIRPANLTPVEIAAEGEAATPPAEEPTGIPLTEPTPVEPPAEEPTAP